MASACRVVASAVLFGLLACGAYSKEDGLSELGILNNFDVKPGGQEHEYEASVGNFKCKFKYASQGGTKEEWQLMIKHCPNKQKWSCEVFRPSGTSYLFFVQFRMEVSGAAIHNVAATGERNDLNPSEYQINSDNSVTHVEGKFQSSLNRLAVYASTTREDL